MATIQLKHFVVRESDLPFFSFVESYLEQHPGLLQELHVRELQDLGELYGDWADSVGEDELHRRASQRAMDRLFDALDPVWEDERNAPLKDHAEALRRQLEERDAELARARNECHQLEHLFDHRPAIPRCPCKALSIEVRCLSCGRTYDAASGWH